MCGITVITSPLYAQIDCSSKQIVLSITTIVCLTFFIPLIFYLLCWLIIVKVFKRGDICIKALSWLCLDGKKKNDGLANKEISTNIQSDVENKTTIISRI